MVKTLESPDEQLEDQSTDLPPDSLAEPESAEEEISPYVPEYQPAGKSYPDILHSVRQVTRPLKERLNGYRAKKAGLQGVEQKATSAAASQVGTQATRQVATAGSQVAVTAGEATNPVGWALIAITAAQAAIGLAEHVAASSIYVAKRFGHWLLIFLTLGLSLPAILFIIVVFALGLSDLPDDEAERSAATDLVALSGDHLALGEVVTRTDHHERSRYEKVQALADKAWGPTSAEAKRVKDEVTRLNQLEQQVASETNREQKKLLSQQFIESKRAFEFSLPYGEWVAQIAESYVGDPSRNFCRYTGAPGNLGCASVVSKILFDAGVPQHLCATTMCVWNNRFLTLVVPPAPNRQLDRNLYASQKANLKRGDIVWWGNGIRRGSVAYAGALFNHIGIYLGDGQVVDNSSSKLEVLKQPIEAGVRVFNGAKRYGN